MTGMEANQESPVYTVYVVSNRIKFNVTPALIAIDRSEADNQIAQRVVLTLTNLQIEGVFLSSILTACDRIFVYADDGTKKGEVFRGFLWNRDYKSSISDQKLKVTAYDNLIYLQQSEDTYYFRSKTRTKDIVQKICDDWGIKLVYDYNEFTHPKIPARGKLYDILTEKVLDDVKRHTGAKYVILSDQDVMYVKLYGTNTTIYRFYQGKNVISASSGWSMDNVVTQVAITGEKNADDYEPVVETVRGGTASKYGTLQQVIGCDDVKNTLWRVKVEAKYIMEENGEPKWEYEINGPDIPWIRKGDKVYVDAGDINDRYLYVTAVNRSSDIKSAEMTLTMTDSATSDDNPEPWKD